MDPFMSAAIEEARQGRREGGIPIGSVLVRDGRIVAAGHNRRVQDNDPMAHAEIDCLRRAGRIGSYRGTTLYSTLMPCHYCAGAVVQFGIRKVVAGESATFPGARAFMEQHGVEVTDLDLDACKDLMRAFIAAEPALWNEDIGRAD
jgi:cytosine deaminase